MNIKIDVSKEYDIAKTFSPIADFGLYHPKKAIFTIIVIFITLCFYHKAYFCIILLTYMALLIPSQIFVNFLFYCIFNKGIKGLKIFPYIKLKDITILVYNYEIYKELKKYFLTTKNIDIDKIKRYYFVF